MKGKLVCMSPSGGTIPENAEIEQHECLDKLSFNINSSGVLVDEIITGWILADFGVYWVKVFEKPTLNDCGHSFHKGLECKVEQLFDNCWALTPVDQVYIPVTEVSEEYFKVAKKLISSREYQQHRSSLKLQSK